MPSRRDDVHISEASLWDVIEWDVVSRLAAQAPADKYQCMGRPDLAIPWFAKVLINAGSQSDNSARLRLQSFGAVWIGQGDESERRRKAADLGEQFGADPARFIELLTKYGLFRT